MGEPGLLDASVRHFLSTEVRERFLRYVQIWTTSDPESTACPSTPQQIELLRLLETECQELGLLDVELHASGCLLARLPAGPENEQATSFGLLAHVDTSPDQSGQGVKPVCHENWTGADIHFAKNSDLRLGIEDSPELASFVGDTIITASGDTLLGADDKAGIAEIMAAMACFQRYPELPHSEICICFTTDEEVSRGIEGVPVDQLPTACYTMDGGMIGELEDECFDAWQLKARFSGVPVHPGSAKGVMVHASMAAARLLAALPEAECPERTEGREGFYYLVQFSGEQEQAELTLLVRDFDAVENKRRREEIVRLAGQLMQRQPRLKIDLSWEHQYSNMKQGLRKYPEITERAARAIEDAGVQVLRKEIRGGTDGSTLTEMGHPTPNIFTGGLMYHSKKEWVPQRALTAASETIVHLARRWCQEEYSK